MRKLILLFFCFSILGATAQVKNTEEPQLKIKTKSYSQKAANAGTASGILFFASSVTIISNQVSNYNKDTREMLAIVGGTFAFAGMVFQAQSWHLMRKSVKKRQELELKAKGTELGLVLRF